MERLFDLDLQLIADSVFTAVNVFFLVIVASYLFFNPVRDFLKSRQEWAIIQTKKVTASVSVLRWMPKKLSNNYCMMKLKNLFLTLVALLLVVSAAAQNIRSYESHGGIWFEKFETDTNLFIYSSDNTIYIPHQQRTFTYSYQKNSVQYLFQSTGEKNWKLVPINEATDSAAVTIIMQIIADSATLGYGSAHSGKTGQSILHRSFYNKFSKRLPITNTLINYIFYS